MPAYSFQARFVPFVLDGSKTHTVRNRRRYPAKVGSTVFLYSGLRTKWTKFLRKEVCSKTCSISISPAHGIIIYDRLLNDIQLYTARKKPNASTLKPFTILSPAEVDVFAWKDGFRPEGSTLQNPVGAYALMLRFWSQTHSLPWVGDIIYWVPSNTIKIPSSES